MMLYQERVRVIKLSNNAIKQYAYMHILVLRLSECFIDAITTTADVPKMVDVTVIEWKLAEP